MSEIFEALRKAQREADARRVADIRQPPVAETASERPEAPVRPAHPAAPAAPGTGRPEPAVRRRWGFSALRAWWRAAWTYTDGPRAPLFTPGRGSPVGEQFRVLRSRVETAGFGTFMVTSALDREGKTLCATNLAFALSSSLGAGVILIDADLRRPNVGSWFGMRRGAGLADCLLGDATWQALLQPTDYERLRVLPAGRESGLSTELLASDRMVALVAEIKAAYPRHYVIIDAPPLLLTADPLVLARPVDHVLLVVRADATPRAAVNKAIEVLGPERFLGIVLNGTTQNLSGYYNYRYSRYAYGSEPDARV